MHRLKKLIIGGYVCLIAFFVMTFIGYCDYESLIFSMTTSFTATMITFILIHHIIYTKGS